MNRINRYLLGHLGWATLLATAILVFVAWLSQSLRLIEVLVDDNAPAGIFLMLVGLAMPDFLREALPLGAAAAILFVYQRLVADSEIVALRAAGVAPLALARPALMLAGGICLLLYTLNLYVVPVANQSYRHLRLTIENQYASVLLRDGQFNDVDDGITVFVRETVGEGVLNGLLVHDHRDPEVQVTMIAERGLLQNTRAGPELVLFKGTRQESEGGGPASVLAFDEYAVRLRVVDPDLGTAWRRPQERFIGDLLNPDLANSNDLRNADRLVAEGHMRLTQPLLVLAMAGLALGSILTGQHSRRGQPWRVLLAIAALVAVQAMALFAAALTRGDLRFAPLMYVVPLVALTLGLQALRPRGRLQPLGQSAAT